MIDGSEKRNRQLAFELQNSHVCEKRSKTARFGYRHYCKKTYVRSRGKHEDSLLFYTHTFTQRNKFESNKVGTYRNTSLIHKGQRQHLISEKNKGLCNNYLEGGVGKLEVEREWGVGCRI